MQGMTDLEYAAMFKMLAFMDRREFEKTKNAYEGNMKYILETYSKLCSEHSELILYDTAGEYNSTKAKENTYVIEQLCRMHNLELIRQHVGAGKEELFKILLEAIRRGLLLVEAYARGGTELASILRESYCRPYPFSEMQICHDHNISRATMYRKKTLAVRYMGYFFFEYVLPDMEGKLYL